jgi:hypothetical protein
MRGDAYYGDKVVQESGNNVGDITDVRLINEGNGYTSLPTLSITSSVGTGAKVLAYGSEIGRALTINVIEAGYNYEASPSPTIIFPTYLLITRYCRIIYSWRNSNRFRIRWFFNNHSNSCVIEY